MIGEQSLNQDICLGVYNFLIRAEGGMFSDSIDNKVNKIKLNFDNYLNDKRKDNTAQPPVPSIRRPDQLAPNYTTSSQTNPNLPSSSNLTSVSNLQSKPIELQIKQLIVQGKVLDKQLSLKNIAKEKTINIFYSEEQQRYRLEIKALDNNLQLKISQQKSSVDMSFKKATKYKFFRPETGQPKWVVINGTDLKEEQITIICNKDWKTIKSCFDGFVPEQMIKVEVSQVKEEKEKIQGAIIQREEGIDAEDIVNFIMPTPQQFTDTEKFRKSLKDMKEEEKTMILMDIFKIKKQYDDPTQLDKKKFKCPIHACQKNYRDISQLKTHMKKHPELNKHGIQLTDYGTFQFSYKAMDLALFLGKLYPFEMKKIIKKMKTRQIGE